MTDDQDRRLRLLEDKFSAVTATTDHLLTAQAEMTDSIAALHTQAAGFGKAQEATTGTLALLADNVAKLVAGLPTAQAAGPPAPAAPPTEEAAPPPAGLVVPTAAYGSAPTSTVGCDKSAPY